MTKTGLKLNSKNIQNHAYFQLKHQDKTLGPKKNQRTKINEYHNSNYIL